MIDSAFDLGEEAKLKEVLYKLHQPSWGKYNFSAIDLDLTNWTTIKYLNDEGDGFHEDIDQLPDNSGGIYLFSIRCPIIPGLTEFPAYVGRAKFTENQNLRKRCREYFNKWHRSVERPKITRLIKYWKHELYLSFLEIEDNELIEAYEKMLINSLLLPFNDMIPDKEMQQAIKAFQT